MLNRKAFFAVLFALFTLMAVAPAFAQAPAEVKVWIAFTDKRLDWAREKAAEFNALYPQYNVVIEGYSNYEELFNATALAAEQGQIPAVVQYFEVATQVARDSGYFKPIAEAIGDRTEINGISTNLDIFVDPVVSYYTLDGKFTSMPWNTSSSIFFVNKTQLEAAGVTDIPATWADVEAACEKIAAYAAANNAGEINTTDENIVVTVPSFCFTFPNHGWFFEQWLAQQNAIIAAPDNGRGGERATEIAFNNEGGLALLTWLKDMHNKGYLYYSGGRNGASWGTVDQAFLTGQVAMAAYSSSDTALYTSIGAERGFEIVATFLPYNQETGWTGNIIGGASLWLSNGLAKDVEDGALTFLFWLNNAENAAEWHQITGYVPVTEAAVELLESQGWFEANPNFAVAGDQLAQSQVTFATSGAIMGDFPAIRNVVTAAIDKLLLTPNADPATVLAEAAAAAQEILDEYNLLNQ
jgi:sn-glycerol 3-phosphate transport system substrate-binding protein